MRRHGVSVSREPHRSLIRPLKLGFPYRNRNGPSRQTSLKITLVAWYQAPSNNLDASKVENLDEHKHRGRPELRE